MVGSARGRFIFPLALVVLVLAPSFLLVVILLLSGKSSPLLRQGVKLGAEGGFTLLGPVVWNDCVCSTAHGHAPVNHVPLFRDDSLLYRAGFLLQGR